MWTNLGERGYSSLKDGHKTHYSSGRTILRTSEETFGRAIGRFTCLSGELFMSKTL